jgi:hypothetical protein
MELDNPGTATQTPTPSSNNPPPAHKPVEPLLKKSTMVAPATTKKLLLWPWLMVIGVVFMALFIGLLIWAFAGSSKNSERAGNPSSSDKQKSRLRNTDPAITDTDIDNDPNAPTPAIVTHGDLKITLACEPGNKQILCSGLVENIGNDDGDFFFTGTDYPQHGWARDAKGDLARIVVDAEHFQLGDRTHWNNWHVWMPAKSVTKFWFSYESRNPDTSQTVHIDLDMMWGGDNSLGFNLPDVPINRTTYRIINQ